MHHDPSRGARGHQVRLQRDVAVPKCGRAVDPIALDEKRIANILGKPVVPGKAGLNARARLPREPCEVLSVALNGSNDVRQRQADVSREGHFALQRAPGGDMIATRQGCR